MAETNQVSKALMDVAGASARATWTIIRGIADVHRHMFEKVRDVADAALEKLQDKNDK
jgi:hypothetical protein